jgi:hypothetical protein
MRLMSKMSKKIRNYEKHQSTKVIPTNKDIHPIIKNVSESSKTLKTVRFDIQAPAKVNSQLNTSKSSTTSPQIPDPKPTQSLTAQIKSLKSLISAYKPFNPPRNQPRNKFPKHIKSALEMRMRTLDAMDDNIAQNVASALYFQNYGSAEEREKLEKFIFESRQRKYRKEPSMQHQVRS